MFVSFSFCSLNAGAGWGGWVCVLLYSRLVLHVRAAQSHTMIFIELCRPWTTGSQHLLVPLPQKCLAHNYELRVWSCIHLTFGSFSKIELRFRRISAEYQLPNPPPAVSKLTREIEPSMHALGPLIVNTFTCIQWLGCICDCIVMSHLMLSVKTFWWNRKTISILMFLEFQEKQKGGAGMAVIWRILILFSCKTTGCCFSHMCPTHVLRSVFKNSWKV